LAVVGMDQHGQHRCKVQLGGPAGTVGTRHSAGDQQKRKNWGVVMDHKVGHKQGGKRKEGSKEGAAASRAGTGEGQGGFWGPREGTRRSKNQVGSGGGEEGDCCLQAGWGSCGQGIGARGRREGVRYRGRGMEMVANGCSWQTLDGRGSEANRSCQE